MDRVNATRELSGMGYRLTRQRVAILEVLSKTSSHLTAEQVYRRVRKKVPNTNLATVYRNLGLMAEEGIIGKADFGEERTRFEANPMHHHHLVCLGCGKVQEISDCPVHIEEQFLKEAGFRLVHHQFEAFGYCQRCSGGIAR